MRTETGQLPDRSKQNLTLTKQVHYKKKLGKSTKTDPNASKSRLTQYFKNIPSESQHNKSENYSESICDERGNRGQTTTVFCKRLFSNLHNMSGSV